MERSEPGQSLKQRGRSLRIAGLAARVGASYGKSLVARTLGLTSDDQLGLTHEKNAARILETAIAMRGPFMKLVQLLSFQGEMLPDQYLDALSTVQDKAPPLPWDQIEPVLAAEFGRPPAEVFGSIEPEPLAAASLGQVYAGTLPDGTRVAIKVQYPGVREVVAQDLRAIHRMLATQKLVGGGLLRIPGLNYDDVFADLSDRLHEEIDYRREASNIEIFRRIYAGWDSVAVPQVYREFSTGSVLTMDRMDGAPLSSLMRSETPYAQREQLVLRMANMFEHEFSGVGVVQADPHPGNRLVGLDGTIKLLDFGCIKVIPRRLRDGYVKITRAVIDGDDARVLEGAREVGFYSDGPPEPVLAWLKFSNYPRTIDGPYDPSRIDYGAEFYQRMMDLTRHGYVNFPPHTLFMMRIFLGAAAILRAMKVTTINERRRSLDFFANRLAEGNRVRDELERDGLIPIEL
jgi:predicted unusual protein kinase regulating ubiquinone biosynthesis (AarF/ABC1/UbiB family)